MNLIPRIKVILSSFVFYLQLLAMVLMILVDELPALGPVGESAVRVIASLLVVVTVAILIIQRVTRVLPSQVGLLPPEPWKNPSSK
jgi:hypothetical protein